VNERHHEHAVRERWTVEAKIPLSGVADGASWHRARSVRTGELVTLFMVRGELALEVADAARRAYLVENPRLLPVLDVTVFGDPREGEDESAEGAEDTPLTVVEYPAPPAPPLAALFAQGQLRPETARSVIGEAATGLEAARRRGLRHQFLDSNRVFVDTADGTVRVLGVGVEAASHRDAEHDGRVASFLDTTALVALLYRALTGSSPSSRTESPLPRPSTLTSRSVPQDLDLLCELVLTEADEAVPETTRDLIAELEPWQSIPVTLEAYDPQSDGGRHRSQPAGSEAPAAGTAPVDAAAGPVTRAPSAPDTASATAPAPASAPDASSSSSTPGNTLSGDDSKPRDISKVHTSRTARRKAAADAASSGGAASAQPAATDAATADSTAGDSAPADSAAGDSTPGAPAADDSASPRSAADDDGSTGHGGAGAAAALGAAGAAGALGGAVGAAASDPETTAAPEDASTTPAGTDSAAGDQPSAPSKASDNTASRKTGKAKPDGQTPSADTTTGSGTSHDSSAGATARGGDADQTEQAPDAAEPADAAAERTPATEEQTTAAEEPEDTTAAEAAEFVRTMHLDSARNKAAFPGHLDVQERQNPLAEAAMSPAAAGRGAVLPANSRDDDELSLADTIAQTPIEEEEQSPGPIIVRGRPSSQPEDEPAATGSHRGALMRDVVGVAMSAEDSSNVYTSTTEPESERSRQSQWILIGAVLVVIVALVFAITSVTSGLRQTAAGPNEQTTVATQPTDEATDAQVQPTDPTEEESSAPPPTIGAPEVVAEGGNGNADNSEDAKRMTDGSKDSYWSSKTYQSAQFGGLKDGLGVKLPFEKTSTLKKMTVTTADSDGGTLELYSMNEDGERGDKIGSGSFSEDGDVELKLDDPVESDGVELWISELPSNTDGDGFRARIAEIKAE
jgi:hypothetical protein